MDAEVNTYVVVDRQNPSCGWVVVMDPTITWKALDYVRLSTLKSYVVVNKRGSE